MEHLKQPILYIKALRAVRGPRNTVRERKGRTVVVMSSTAIVVVVCCCLLARREDWAIEIEGEGEERTSSSLSCRFESSCIVESSIVVNVVEEVQVDSSLS